MGLLRDLFGRDRLATVGGSPLAPPVTSQRALSRGIAEWVPPGGSILVDGRRIDGGMVFVGSQALSLDGRMVDPCLIDPSLKVSWGSPDHAGASMDYWPSYSLIDPRARAAYLSWLAAGREHPSACIGYVFLFFYGLERRLVHDLVDDLPGEEATALVGEVHRLLEIYGDNYSFGGYAERLLEFVELSRLALAPIDVPKWDSGSRDWRVPPVIRVALGRFVAAGQPIPPEWALAYLRFHPESYLRTPAQRCSGEFDTLFQVRYRQRFGDGMKVRPPATKLSAAYDSASAGIGRSVNAHLGQIPDVTSVSGPIDKLKDLASAVTDELDAYSRFMGRRPGEAGTPAAIALLPDELVTSHGGGVIDSLTAWTDAQLGDGASVSIEFSELLARWAPQGAERFAKRDAVALASMLDKLNVGIEPDVRFGAPTPKVASTAVLFRRPAGSTSSPSSAYTAAMSLVHLTAVVAAADGSISAAEQEHLAQHTEHVLGLDAGERARLEAHLMLLAATKVGMTGAKRKIEGMAPVQRRAVGRFLVDVAAADGVVSPAEISTLTKVFAQLQLDEADLFSQVHALETSDQGPVTVSSADPAHRWAVPAPVSSAEGSAVVLDPAKVQARLAETASVAALLTDIFRTEDVPPVPAPASASPVGGAWAAPTLMAPSGAGAPTPPSPPGSLAPRISPATSEQATVVHGLDAVHAALGRRLAERGEWQRADAEDLADELGIAFLDAAVERINDAAFDLCGEPLVEGDDPLELNLFAVEEMFR
jgi:uncharacterized tellurite resistance protein B-like protein